MISCLIWLLATLLGGALGLGFSWLTGMNLYLCVGIGIALGNSAGVTANIFRGRDIPQYKSDLEIDTSVSDSEIFSDE